MRTKNIPKNLELKVKVTRDDIDKGIRGSARWCPVARAIKHAKPGVRNITVGCSGIYLIYKSYYYALDCIPDKVKNFICKFDDTGKGGPFSFVLRLKHQG